MTSRFMLDTNAASAVIKGASPALDKRLASGHACISVVTEAELRFGLARRPQRAALVRIVQSFLSEIPILPWTSDCAQAYALMRAELEVAGRPLGALDMMIAAHAFEADRVLVTRDQAFSAVRALSVEAW